MLRQIFGLLTDIFGHRTNPAEMLTVFGPSSCPQDNGAPIIVPGPDILFI